MLYVEKGIPAHAFELASKLRQQDKYELALMGNDPINALLAPFRFNRPNINTYTVLEQICRIREIDQRSLAIIN